MSEETVPYLNFSVRPGTDLGEQLATRGESSGAIAKRDLQRYYRLLERELAHVSFTPAEVDVLLWAVHARYDLDADALMAMPLWAIVDEWIAQHTQVVAGPAFVAKLRALSPGAIVAIVDAIDRFRRGPMSEKQALGRTAALRAVGLLPPPDPEAFGAVDLSAHTSAMPPPVPRTATATSTTSRPRRAPLPPSSSARTSERQSKPRVRRDP